MPTYVEKCTDSSNYGYIQKDGDGYEKACCEQPWFAALYVAGFNETPCAADPPLTGNARSHVVNMISVRSDRPSGTVFDVPLTFYFAVNDPDAPCTEDNPSGGIIYLQPNPEDLFVELTAGYDTAGVWTHFATLSGFTMEAEGSLGNTYTFDVPTVEVWINSFRAVDRFAVYGQPPEYGIPLLCPPEDILNNFSCFDLQSILPDDYPVKWIDAFAAANAFFSIASGEDPFGRYGVYVPGTISPQDTSYYDPDNLKTLNVVPFNYPNPLEAAFWKALYATPRNKSVDDLFDLVVESRNVYRTVKETCGDVPESGKYGFPEPYMALVFPIDSELIQWDSLDVEQCPSSVGIIGDIGFKWTFTNCQFLCRAGTKFLNVYHAYDGYFDRVVGNGLSQLYFDDPWITKSGPIRVKTGAAKYWAINYTPEGVALVAISSDPIRGTDAQALRVRILDAAGIRSNRYNIVPTATPLVTAALTETGGNFHSSPSLEGYTSDQLAAVAGVAEFSDLNVIGLGRNYRVAFSAPSPLVTTGYDSVDLSIATDLAIDDPGPCAAGVDVDIVVRMIDGNGDPLIPTSADDIILSGEGSFSGYASINPTSGVATFTGNFPGAGVYTVKAEVSRANYDGPSDATGSTIPAVTLIVTVS